MADHQRSMSGPYNVAPGPHSNGSRASDRLPASGPTHETVPLSPQDGPGPLLVAWRNRRLLTAAGAVVGVLTFALSLLIPEVYQAKTTLAFPASATAIGLTGGDAERTRALRTESAQITSLGLVREAASRLNDDLDAQELLDQIEADPSSDADLITVETTAGSGVRAAEIANTVAETYLDRLSTRLQGRVDRLNAESRALNRRAQQQQNRLNTLVQEAAGGQSAISADQDPAVAAARLRLEATLSQQIEIQQELDQARADNADGSAVQILMPADAPDEPVRPKPVRYALTSMLLTVLGLVAVRWWRAEEFPAVLESAEQIEAVLDVPVLAVVPDLEGSPLWTEVVSDRSSNAIAGYRMIAATGALRGSVLVTAARTDERCTTLTRDLAAVLARDGWRALIVEGARRDDRLHESNDNRGLTDLLTGKSDIADCIVAGDIGAQVRIGLMPWGSRSADLLHHAHAHLQWAIERLTAVADVALIDGPPLLSSPDAVVWAKWVDRVLPVVTVGTPMADVQRLRKRLEQLNRPVAGVVVREPMRSRSRRRGIKTEKVRWTVPSSTARRSADT